MLPPIPLAIVSKAPISTLFPTITFPKVGILNLLPFSSTVMLNPFVPTEEFSFMKTLLPITAFLIIDLARIVQLSPITTSWPIMHPLSIKVLLPILTFSPINEPSTFLKTLFLLI